MQPHPLVQTKLYIPPIRPELVSRPRLTERLNAGLHRKLTLISAPAGFGKTTVLSEWVAGCGRLEPDVHVAWLSLDEGDNDPACFLTYLIIALQTIPSLKEAGVGEVALHALESPQPVPAETILTTLINEIVPIPDRFVLILDDYHLLEAQPIHQAIAFLLGHLPPQMHLILASRTDPFLRLSRLRARGQMTEIRADDLRFTLPEATMFFNRAMGLALSDRDVSALDSRTEGWITGLHLAALSMQGTADPTDFISSFAGDNRYVADYLIDEVLARQAESTRDFLLQTCILDRLTGPLCDAVCFGGTAAADQREGQQVLERLEQANLFVVPLDDRRQWYRYHHLFADMLRHRLRRTWPDRIPELHERASAWYEAQGDAGEAFRHALAAGDPHRAADIIEPIAMTMIAESRLSRLLGWLARLPDELVAARPWLCVSGAWANLLTGQTGSVESLLQFAESTLSEPTVETSTDEGQIYGHVTTIRAFLARWQEGEIARSIELSQEASNYVPADSAVARCALALNLGNAHLLIGDLAAAASALDEARTVAQKGNIHYVALAAPYYLGQVQVGQGRLRQAATTYRQTLQLGTKWGGGRPLPATGYAHVGLGQVLYEWNDLDKALIHLTRGIELGEQANEVSIVLDGTLTLVELKQARGEISAASETLDHVQEILAKSTRAQVSSQLSARQAQLWLAHGNFAAALRWARDREALVNDKVQYARMPEYLALARVLIAQGRRQPGGSQLADVSNLLAHLLRAAESAGWTGSAIAILVLQALARQAQGEVPQALVALEKALALGEAEGYVRVFIDGGAAMADLLPQAAARGVAPQYVRRLLAALGAEDVEIAAAPSPPSRSGLPEPLTGREIEVLQLLGEGYSNREIAETLVITLDGVKKHNSNIYGKLGVHSRTQAVVRAQELGLL